MTLAELNGLDRAAFVAALGGAFEHSPWIAEAAWDRRPFASVDALHAAMVAVVREGGEARQLALLRAHPELAGKAMVRRELTADSTREQAGAGLDQCSPEEFARLTDLNARYNAKFGFPFILAVKGHDRAGILREFARRMESERATEIAECLSQVARIARLRIDGLVGAPR
jgi:2-oxo-4-hydroxy-4-carboxy-5-ureidoimidazoline decarboxylase